MYNLLKETVKKNANRIAIEYKDMSLTYEELNRIVVSLGNTLFSCDGNRYNIGIVSNDPLLFTISLFAISYSGNIPIPIYAHTGKKKICEMVNHFSIEYLIVENYFEELSILFKDRKRIDFINAFLCKNVTCMKNAAATECRLILLTSGTTGIQKGIMLSENNITSNVNAISKYLKITKEDRILLVKNMNHASSIIGELMVGIANGCTIVFNSKVLTVSNMIALLEKKKITVFFAVPTILKEIIINKHKTNRERFRYLRTINFYGAPMSVEDIKSLMMIFPKCNLIYSYGLTEASPRVSYIERKDLANKPGSCGKAIDDVKIRINKSNENGIGEIVVSGPNVMLGYYNDSIKTSKVIIEGELYTGDFGYVDAEGYLYVYGRKDNMIISAGKNIYPEEIEKTLQAIVGVKEVLVRGILDNRGIIKLIAYLAVDDGFVFDKKYFFDFCKDRLENYKVPTEYFQVQQFKKTVSGKIIRDQAF